MNTQEFSPQQSLQIIRSMIEKTRQNLGENAYYFLLWGWLVFTASLIHYGLMQFTSFNQPWLAWNLIWIGVVASVVRGVRDSRKETVKTYTGETMKFFGMTMGIIYMSLVFIFSFYQIWHFAFPVYIMVYGAACFFMGKIMEFTYLVWAGVTCLGIMVLSLYTDYREQLLLLAFAVMIAYIIPGHLLQKKYSQQKNKV